MIPLHKIPKEKISRSNGPWLAIASADSTTTANVRWNTFEVADFTLNFTANYDILAAPNLRWRILDPITNV